MDRVRYEQGADGVYREAQGQVPQRKIGWGEAFKDYLHDANVPGLVLFGRKAGLWLMGYAPFAAVNDAAAALLGPIPLVDDITIPAAAIVILKTVYEVNKYRDPNYQPRRGRRR